MGVNILQIFRGSIILEKSPSSDIPCVCLMLGDESNGGSIFLRSLSSFDIGYLFSFKYWIALTLSLLFYLSGVTYSATLIAQDTTIVSAVSSGGSLENTGNGSIDFSFGQLLYANEIAGSYHVNQGIQQPSIYELASSVSSLSCENYMIDNPVLWKGEMYHGVVILPYLGGNGANYLGLNISSSSVKGLTMTLPTSKLAKGNGSIELVLKGVPADTGIALFNLVFGAKTCPISLRVYSPQPELSVLRCDNLSLNPSAVGKGLDYKGEVSITYSGGNNVKTAPVSLSSQGVNGLVLTSDSLLLNPAGGVLKYTLLGKPGSAGTAIFSLQTGGKSCTVSVKVLDSEMIKVSDFFSPNGDGVNDYWTIPELDLLPDSRVFVFDRFGRTLVESVGNSFRWDGLINNIPAPVDSYWYLVKLNENETLRGNFTLMR
jgi:gliding motility-associated-like protein